jgi:hypothetical protein
MFVRLVSELSARIEYTRLRSRTELGPRWADKRSANSDSLASRALGDAYNRLLELPQEADMQLQLTRQEQVLLVEVLQEIQLTGLRQRARDNLLNRVIEHQLEFPYDELEDLSDFLADVSRRLHDQLINAEDENIRRRQKAVQQVLDKVIEAEAMV